MLVSPKYANKNKLRVANRVIVMGGKLHGMQICVVNEDHIPEKDNKIDNENIFGCNLKIKDPDSRMLIMFPTANPGAHGKRNSMLLIGTAGAGKTTNCTDYALLYRLYQYPNPVTHPIYWISRICDDPRLNRLKGKSITIDNGEGEKIKRYIDSKMVYINILSDAVWDKYFVDPDTKLELYFDDTDESCRGNLTNSLVILDDVSGLDPKKSKILENLVRSISNLGRHACTNLIWSRHEYSGYKQSERSSLSEFNFVSIYYRNEMDMRQLNKFSSTILNLPALPDYAQAVGNESNYVTVCNSSPGFVLTKNQIVIV